MHNTRRDQNPDGLSRRRFLELGLYVAPVVVAANYLGLVPGEALADCTSESSGPPPGCFTVNPLNDPDKAYKVRSTAPLKFNLGDGQGNNASSEEVVVHAIQIERVGATTTYDVESPGNSNPDHDFRFSDDVTAGGGYIFNLDTRGLTSGKYKLLFTVAGESADNYELVFQLK